MKKCLSHKKTFCTFASELIFYILTHKHTQNHINGHARKGLSVFLKKHIFKFEIHMTRKTKISVTSKQQDNSELEFKQYYDITMARYSYTMIEMRIFLCLLYLSNRYTELGENKDSIGEIYDGEYGQKIISIRGG